MSGPPAAAHPLVHVLVHGAPADQAQVQIHGSGSGSGISSGCAAHDQGRRVSSGRGAGSDSGSVVGQRQHWKTGATVVPTTTRVYRLWRLSTSTVCFCDHFDVLRDATSFCRLSDSMSWRRAVLWPETVQNVVASRPGLFVLTAY